MLRPRSVRDKLVASHGALIAFSILIGATAYWGVLRMGQESLLI